MVHMILANIMSMYIESHSPNVTPGLEAYLLQNETHLYVLANPKIRFIKSCSKIFVENLQPCVFGEIKEIKRIKSVAWTVR